jgi:hypothetical protein
MNSIDFFQKNGYCIVKSAISDELRDFITQYALFDEMQNFAPEGSGAQVPEAHSKYADPAMETLLLQLGKTISDNTGLEVHPTYSYYRVYRPGDDLKAHTDRESCEISCTLCFNHSYSSLEYRWPIFMDGYPVVLAPGDLVIYRGCDLKHWRDEFNFDKEDAWHVQGFFHWVDINGPYTEFKFDKRDSIGERRHRPPTNVSSKPYIKYT